MSRSFTSLSCIVVLASTLSACAAPSRQSIGIGTGAVVGGVVGGALTGSRLGAIGGAAVGGVVGNKVAR